MWSSLFKPVVELASTVIKGKQRIKEAEIGAKEKAIASKDNWELEMARASGASWKDEWLVLLFSMPFIMSFIPSLVPYVQDGFAALSEAPQWYSISLGAMISASFGIRIYDKFNLKK